jgi:hypothetical protein
VCGEKVEGLSESKVKMCRERSGTDEIAFNAALVGPMGARDFFFISCPLSRSAFNRRGAFSARVSHLRSGIVKPDFVTRYAAAKVIDAIY